MRCRRLDPIPEEVRRTADLLERRWTVSILYAAHSGAVRFNEFAQSVGRIPPTTLAARLAELEAAGILERRVVDTRPPRVDYVLTERGQALKVLLEAVARFAELTPAR
jgi:DNA-binding HxlR family transcriptional regulator